MLLVIVNTLVKMDDAANGHRGRYRVGTRSGAAREDDRYQWRSRENPRSGAVREAHSHRHGTSSPSPRLVQNSPACEVGRVTDEEDSESSDSGSSDNEHKSSKLQKRQVNNPYSGTTGKGTKDALINNPYSGTTGKGTKDVLINNPLINNAYSGTTGKGTKDVLINNPYSGATGKGTKDTLINNTCNIIPEKGTTYMLINNTHNSTADKDSSSTQTCVILISIIILVVAAFSVSFQWYNNDLSLEERKSQLQDRFREIRKQFPTQNDDVWLTLLAGIKKVEEDPSQPSTFLLLHEVEDETPKCLAVKTSKAATEFLKATDPSPLKLQGEELGANDRLINDHGILISEQKENITNHRAMIVFNLHKIPASVAQSFHYFCDEYNPVVQRAVYFFTMSVGKRLHNNPTFFAESELKKLWQQQLETDKLQPLIVRLTTSVMVIKPEERLVSLCDS